MLELFYLATQRVQGSESTRDTQHPPRRPVYLREFFLIEGKFPHRVGRKFPQIRIFFCLFLPNQLLQNPHHINKLKKGIKDKVQRETYLGFRNECYNIFPIANKREYNIVRNSSFSNFQWYKSRDI